MSKRDFLLELGLEEMPAKAIEDAVQQLKNKLEAWLTEQFITYEQVKAYATPRRLAVLVTGMAEQQQDRQEEAKGPAKKIALDEQGEWTKAAQGFARGQGVSTDDLFFKELKGVEYAYVVKHIRGEQTKELLPSIQSLITGMHFPKNMRWGSHSLPFVRPIRWIVALFGDDIIPLEITQVQAGNQTQGHRFLGSQVTIENPLEYETKLLEQFVIANAEERKQAIVTQLSHLEEERGWVIPIDPDLLQEVTYLVEYPTALFGSFDPAFLEIPQEVLITSMKEHQRYFPVQDQHGSLLPHFVTVRNGDVDPQDVVSKGNEKVLRARLADARFFYEEDKKLTIPHALEKLEKVVFYEGLGTLGDKLRRIQEIGKQLGKQLSLTESAMQVIDRAAQICKFDLVSQMVYEFPELQGRMGQEYAKLAGEEEAVADVIVEHYLPRFAGDRLPSTPEGAAVSVADKLDTIVGCFGLGLVPTGSQDPYALRRQASGIVQIAVNEQWQISLRELFQPVIALFEGKSLLQRPTEDVMQDLESFFLLRVKNRLQEHAVRYDVIDAVMDNPQVELASFFHKADVLMKQVEVQSFKPFVEAFTRVSNLAAKAEEEGLQQPINTSLLQTEAERHLFETYQAVSAQLAQAMQQKKWGHAYDTLQQLQEPIQSFFEHVMVMVEDDQIRHNRLVLLKEIAQTIKAYANLSKIVFA